MILYLMDANCAVYAMDGGYPTLRERILACSPGDIAISVISYAEVAYGTYVDKPPSEEVLEAFVKAIPLLPFDELARHDLLDRARRALDLDARLFPEQGHGVRARHAQQFSDLINPDS